MSLVPSNIGLLTQLHTLELGTDSAEQDVANLEWITQLTYLQNLSISCCRCNHRTNFEHVSLLTKLTRLQILGLPTHGWIDELPVANLDIEWHRLRALQDLFTCHVRLQLGQGTIGLLQLQDLRHNSFAGSLVHCDKDHGYFAALMQNFARLCPEVKLVFDSENC